MSEKKPSSLSSALSVTFVALGAVNMVLLAIFLITSIIDVAGAGVDYFEDGDARCYMYRASISCMPLRKAAPPTAGTPSVHRPVWGLDQG